MITEYERCLVPVLFRPLAQAVLAAARPIRGRRCAATCPALPASTRW
jgi:hypothetical protein